jgi:anti-sigma regulatory factor (Ser/Thr protein kinase)
MATAQPSGTQVDLAETLLLDNEPLEIARAAAWLDGLLGEIGLSPRAIAALQVALDEVLSNILVHGYADLETHKIEVRMTSDTSMVTLVFVDDGIPFDPTQHDTSSPGDDAGVRPGGLGLVFIRRLMDDMTFERVDGRNHLTLRKFLSR